MKTIRQGMVGSLVLMAILMLVTGPDALGQTNRFRPATQFSLIPIFTNNPVAMYVITNLLQEPMPELSVPAVSQVGGTPGTYWVLKGAPAPLPFNPYPELAVYQVSTNGQFIIDDRSVDYATLDELNALEAEAFGSTNTTVFTGCQTCAWDESGLLWIEVPTNSLATPDFFTVALHNTVQGQSYDVMTTPDLIGSFATELVVTGAVGTVTSVQIPMNNRTNLFVRARTSVAYSFYLVSLPLSQDVLAGDTVTFYVETGGNANLTFQWTLNGSAIAGATNSSYTIYNVQTTDAGDYACIISDGTNSLLTAAGTLTVENGTGDLNIMAVVSARQNYTFKSGVTYYLGSQIEFYGNTTIEAGAVIKPDWYYNAGLVIMGKLTCKGEPYYPAVITSVDDDSIGAGLGFSQQDGPPQPNITGVPYLELACCKSNSISNLRIAYADYGVTTPTDLRRLEVWDCQFLQCNYGIVNLVAGDSTNTLHNVLFAACSAAFGAATNAITIEAEQVTADVGDFCLASVTPSRMSLTNCIIWGNSPTASSMASVHVELNPDETNFVSAGAGFYYLAANSPLHQAGTSGISPRLQTELKNKTTFAPVTIAPFTQISGQITFAPQAQRYTNGAPDIGYHYDALDYTVASLILNSGTLNVLPGTAIGLRMEYVPAYQNWTYAGFNLGNNSVFTGQGMPNKACVFVDVQQVQEQFQWPVIASFIPNYFPAKESDQPPTLSFRFANFYAGYVSYYKLPQYHFWSGISLYGFEWSLDSAMNFTLQDCKVRGGQIDIGTPDNPDNGAGLLNYDTVLGSGAIAWNNNLFDGVSINLNPTYYWYNQTVNCDMQVTAYNNLFRNSAWLIISGIPATAGNWTFRDNLFDKVQFYQNPALPLDFDHNGYWPLMGQEIVFGASGYTNYLQATATSSGETEVFLAAVPPYQGGAFGNYYLSQTTPLYQAGSRTAGDANLTQYTTFTSQSKDASGQPVNIGLHYVAATNSLPLDSDSDGVPDYVEAEHGTDLSNAMTDGVTNDTYNVAYDDVDLSGNGMVGRIKNALGQNPLEVNNPLIATQIVVAVNSGLASLEVPVSYNIMTNIGRLKLLVDGNVASFQQCESTTNGHCLLVWNTTFDSPTNHYLQIQLLLNGQHHQGSTPDPTVLTGVGKLELFNSTNICQFDPFYSSFDSGGAILYAKTPACPDADYTIELQTESGAHLRTITNSTSTGEISEHWDLTDDNGNVVTNDTIKAVFNVTLLDPADGSLDFWLHRALYGSEDGNFTVSYTWDVDHEAGGTMRDAIQYGVVDPLMAPLESGGSGSENPYPSTFNEYTWSGNLNGNPGYLSNQADANNLVTNLSDVDTMNFYFDGHGSPSTLGDDKRLQVAIFVTQISFALGNRFTPAKGMQCDHPYRFVFLNACDTANDHDWAHAFGILDSISPAQVAIRPLGAQAFLGWIGEPRAPDNDDEWNDMAQTFAVFFDAWQSGQYTLQDCIDIASKTHPYGSSYPITLNFPLGKKFFQIFGVPASGAANNFALKIYGYPLIMREGYATP